MSTATTMQPFVEAFLEECHRLGFASRSMGHALRSFAAYVDGLTMKEQALARLEEPATVVPRYRPSDELRQFLEDL